MTYTRIQLLLAVAALSVCAGNVVPPEAHGSDLHTHATSPATQDHDDHDHDSNADLTIPVTVWSERYEVFVEAAPPVMGEPVTLVTRITRLEDFSPQREGPVTFAWQHNTTRLEHTEAQPQQEGIYLPELVFPEAGVWKLSLRIPATNRTDRISLGELTVYADHEQADHADLAPALEGIHFLKEQQWQTPFQVLSVQPGNPELTLPTSAVWLSDNEHRVFVQRAGETFVSQPVTLGPRNGSRLVITSGLEPGERVVTLGAASLVALMTAVSPDGHDFASLTPAHQQLERLDLIVQPARAGGLDAWIRVPGEIKLNYDTTAHIVPRTGGIAKEVCADLGEQVQAGQVLAIIESRDLATAKADYLALIQRLALAQNQYEREQRLYTQQISSEAEYLDAKQKLADIQIQLGAARQRLLILGIPTAALDTLPNQAEETFADYSMTAPFDGTIIRKHIVLGEAVDSQSVVFEIADLSNVWADLTVNQKDIASIQVGQPAVVIINTDVPEVTGSIQYVDPVIDRATRAAVARIVLDNTQGRYRPGLFISGKIRTRQVDDRVIVPRDSVQSVNEERGVFVQCHGGFEFRPVVTGLSDQNHIEILQGLKAGEPVVIKNAFHLKAEMTKQVGGAHAGHAH